MRVYNIYKTSVTSYSYHYPLPLVWTNLKQVLNIKFYSLSLCPWNTVLHPSLSDSDPSNSSWEDIALYAFVYMCWDALCIRGCHVSMPGVIIKYNMCVCVEREDDDKLMFNLSVFYDRKTFCCHHEIM